MVEDDMCYEKKKKGKAEQLRTKISRLGNELQD